MNRRRCLQRVVRRSGPDRDHGPRRVSRRQPAGPGPHLWRRRSPASGRGTPHPSEDRNRTPSHGRPREPGHRRPPAHRPHRHRHRPPPPRPRLRQARGHLGRQAIKPDIPRERHSPGEGTPVLSVVNDDGTTPNGSSTDEIVREGARRMPAVELEQARVPLERDEPEISRYPTAAFHRPGHGGGTAEQHPGPGHRPAPLVGRHPCQFMPCRTRTPCGASRCRVPRRRVPR